MSQKKIVIVNYGFPPNPGIGGRRWAKLAKGLAEKGYKIDIISCEFLKGDTSPWTKETISEGIQLHSLPTKYPNWIRKPGSGLFSGLKYRLAVIYIKLFEKGTVFDPTVFWQNQFSKLLLEICDSDSNLIITGAPFNLMYYAALLKKEGKISSNLIVDFRDPWIDAANYGMANLNASRSNEELKKYLLVCEHSDYISSPNEVLTQELFEIDCSNKNHSVKFKTLTHFFDAEDVFKPAINESNNEEILLLYGGTLYDGTKQHLESLKQDLEELKLEDEGTYNRLKIEIYTPEHAYRNLFNAHKNVFFSKPIGKKIFEKAQKATGILLFYADRNKDYPTSKIFDFLPYKKPFIVYSNGGEVIGYLKEKKWGVSRSDYSGLKQLLYECSINKKSTFDFSNFDSFGLMHKVEELERWFR